MEYLVGFAIYFLACGLIDYKLSLKEYRLKAVENNK